MLITQCDLLEVKIATYSKSHYEVLEIVNDRTTEKRKLKVNNKEINMLVNKAKEVNRLLDVHENPFGFIIMGKMYSV